MGDSVVMLDHCQTCGEEDVVGDPDYAADRLAICTDCAAQDPYPGLDPPTDVTPDPGTPEFAEAQTSALADGEAARYLRLLQLYRRESRRYYKHDPLMMNLDWQGRRTMRHALDAWRAEQEEKESVEAPPFSPELVADQPPHEEQS